MIMRKKNLKATQYITNSSFLSRITIKNNNSKIMVVILNSNDDE